MEGPTSSPRARLPKRPRARTSNGSVVKGQSLEGKRGRLPLRTRSGHQRAGGTNPPPPPEDVGTGATVTAGTATGDGSIPPPSPVPTIGQAGGGGGGQGGTAVSVAAQARLRAGHSQ